MVHTGADAEDLKPEDVRENGSFLRLLSRVIFENVADCGGIRRQAVIQGQGHVYLLDGRTPDPGGLVPAEDIMDRSRSTTVRRWPGRTSTIRNTGCSRPPVGSVCQASSRRRCNTACPPEPQTRAEQGDCSASARRVEVLQQGLCAHSDSARGSG